MPQRPRRDKSESSKGSSDRTEFKSARPLIDESFVGASRYTVAPRSYAKLALSVAALLVVASGGFYAWRAATSMPPFPMLTEGIYALSLEHELFAEGASNAVLEVGADEEASVTFLKSGQAPGTPKTMTDKRPLELLLPVASGALHGKLRLTEVLPDGWTGSIETDAENSAPGSWRMRKLESMSSSSTQQPPEQLKKLLVLRTQRSTLRARHADLQAALQKKDESIRNLTVAITETDRSGKPGTGSGTKPVPDLKPKTEQVAELRSQWALASELTARGRLVLLSRRILDREATWMESMLSPFVVADFPAELQPALEKAEKIQELKHQIESENQSIERVLYPPAPLETTENTAPVGAEASEEDFYSEILSGDEKGSDDVSD